MKPEALLQAAIVPLTNLSVLFALMMFWLLLILVSAAGMLGIWLGIVIVPALFRYLTNLVETIGSNRTPQPPGGEFFRWVGETWSLFPFIIVIALAWASYGLHNASADSLMVLLIAVAGLLYPAMLGVLSVTHSPLQSMNPVALKHFIQRIGFPYLIAPVFLLLIIFLSTTAQNLPYKTDLLFDIFLIFSLHAVIGSIMAPHDIFEDVHIPEAAEDGADEIAAQTEKTRIAALSHAYGFVSRGNRDGGFRHIFDVIEKDPDTVAAWAWFFDRMMRWEQNEHALFFAQHYIHDMLQHGEKIPALKVIIRCRLVNEQFKPLREDMAAVIEAAESSGNIELAAVLKRA